MIVHAGLCRTCSETTLLVFPRGGSFLENGRDACHSFIFSYFILLYFILFFLFYFIFFTFSSFEQGREGKKSSYCQGTGLGNKRFSNRYIGDDDSTKTLKHQVDLENQKASIRNITATTFRYPTQTVRKTLELNMQCQKLSIEESGESH